MENNDFKMFIRRKANNMISNYYISLYNVLIFVIKQTFWTAIQPNKKRCIFLLILTVIQQVGLQLFV